MEKSTPPDDKKQPFQASDLDPLTRHILASRGILQPNDEQTGYTAESLARVDEIHAKPS
jgi:hypothetical protein